MVAYGKTHGDMRKLFCILAFILICLSINAQTKIDITPNPCHGCWGINEIPVLSDSDRVALRLYQPGKLKWYDFRTYKFKGGKRAVWIAYAAAGIMHGGREAMHAESGVFEKRFGVSSTSWFGSEQWRRNYVDLDPSKKHKPNVFNTFRDYYHFSSTAHTTILVSGAVIIGTSKQPVKYKVVDTLIAIGLRSAAASLTYNALR
jgi:hypothetical protein